MGARFRDGSGGGADDDLDVVDIVEDVAMGGGEADGGVAPRAASASWSAAAAAGAGLAAGAAEPAFPPVASDELSVPWFAGFVLRFCSPLSFRVEGTRPRRNGRP